VGASVFVSYSRKDAGLVTPVVHLLRATKGLVFQDLDSIKPGKRWRGQIEKALNTARLVVVFWCLHSLRSGEVRKEYEFALSNGKDILPILLDDTPLPAELGEFQSVNFQGLVGPSHKPRMSRVLKVGGSVGLVLAMIVGITLSLSWWLLWPAEPTEVAAEPTEVAAEPTEVPTEPTVVAAEPTVVPTEPAKVAAEPTEVATEPAVAAAEPAEVVARPTVPPTKAPDMISLLYAPILFVMILIITIFGLFLWLARIRRRRLAGALPADYHHRMSETLQAEFAKRGLSST